MSTTTLGDIEVAHTEAGSGDPVVFIHGLAEDRASWQVQQRDLVDLRTYSYDLRGHGQTTLGDAEGTLAQLGSDLIRFLEQVSGPATVVGFSLGGTIALWAAAERPDLVPHVVVLGTSSVVGRAAAEFYGQRISQAADTTSSEFRDGMRQDTEAALTTARDRLDEIVSARLGAVGSGGGYRNAARAMAGLRDAPLTPRLAEVKVPVDVVGATGDTFCPPKATRIIVDALGDVVQHEIRDAGHLMNADNPGAVTDVVRAAISGRK